MPNSSNTPVTNRGPKPKVQRGRPKKGTKKKHFTPKKPYQSYPLTAVAGGQWVKRISGKLFYFGRWAKTVNGKLERLPDDGWKEALALYEAQAADLHAGRTPRPEAKKGELTVADMCNSFLAAKFLLVQSEELKPATFQEYKTTCERLTAAFGRDTPVDNLQPIDFQSLRVKLRQTLCLSGVGGQIGKIKSVFKHAKKSDLVPDDFKKPKKAVLRKERAKGGKKLFTREEVLEILNGRKVDDETTIPGAEGQLKAMVLLGINCGLGNTDISELQFQHLDIVKGWMDFPRPKTGVDRKSKLWKETCEVIQECIDNRPEPICKWQLKTRAPGGENWQLKSEAHNRAVGVICEDGGVSRYLPQIHTEAQECMPICNSGPKSVAGC